jgi:phage terminase large subunit-like protein
MVFSAPKKSMKTELAALIVITMIVLFAGEYGEANIIANDQKQAVDRCFTAFLRIIAASSLLCNEVKCTSDKITFIATGSTISALTNDAAGIAGGHPVISVFDELWTAPTGERGRRMHRVVVFAHS